MVREDNNNEKIAGKQNNQIGASSWHSCNIYNASWILRIYIYIYTYLNLLSRRNTITLGRQITRAKALRLIMRNDNIYIHIPQYKSKLSKGNRKETN